MNLAIKETVNDIDLPEKYACVSKKTVRAADLFISFTALEQMVRNHNGKKHPKFLKWVFIQEVKYFNQFIESWTVDHGGSVDELTKHSKPTPAFIDLRSTVMEVLES